MKSPRFFDRTTKNLPDSIGEMLRLLPQEERAEAQEIRLRTAKPLSIVIKGDSYFLSKKGALTLLPESDAFIVTGEHLEECFLRLCSYSVHSHQEEIKQGFVTTDEGDRAGICASAVVGRDGTVTYRDLSSINIRISREAVGCTRGVLRLVDPLKGVLIAGMPSSGKTTMLRDVIRTVSIGETGRILKVAVVDERYELSAAVRGVPRYDLGLCSDVICGQNKAQSIEQAIRTLSPQVIACDEIGSQEEIKALDAGLCCGVAFFATVHCGGRQDLFDSEKVRQLMDTGAFGYILLLDSPRYPGRATYIYTREDYYAKACGTCTAV